MWWIIGLFALAWAGFTPVSYLLFRSHMRSEFPEIPWTVGDRRLFLFIGIYGGPVSAVVATVFFFSGLTDTSKPAKW